MNGSHGFLHCSPAGSKYGSVRIEGKSSGSWATCRREWDLTHIAATFSSILYIKGGAGLVASSRDDRAGARCAAEPALLRVRRFDLCMAGIATSA